MTTQLSVNGLHKRFRGADSAVLKDVSFALEGNELMALVGASGSGKTTLLRIIAGLETADRGDVLLNGDYLTRTGRIQVAPEHRHIGLVFQNHALFPHLDVSGNVAFGLSRSSTRDERVAELIDSVGLKDKAARFPHELSGGERQRVALVRALAPQPALLLLDEPFSSLDQGLRKNLRDQTRRLIRDLGTSSILVTHDTEDALAVADRIVVLRGGTVQQIGTPEAIYGQPANRYVAAAFGECNFLGLEALADKSLLDSTRRIEPVTLSASECWIRPDALRLATGEAGPALCFGEVVDRAYVGDGQRVELRCNSRSGKRFSLWVLHREAPPAQVGTRYRILPRGQ